MADSPPNSETPPHVVNVDELKEIDYTSGDHWGGFDKQLTPSMRPKGGRLGVNLSRLPKGRTMCPFHYHEREDEVFFILSGRGVFRYGDDVRLVRAGDCISCPAGTKVAHQLANPFDEDLTYLCMGPHDPNEVCVYPDSNKLMVRSLKHVGPLTKTEYLDAEPLSPHIFELAKKLT
ncbi:MAG TPA: cupin domain-containing protein [Polyangiaceae bacterium]|nr:cupin domain-containing protein [Polyangiaceae bacterium]